MQEVEAYVALGSNLEDPINQIKRAFLELARLPKTRLNRASSLYCSSPLDHSAQPDFINAVVQLTTTLDPHALLSELFNIEKLHQRQRILHWGPRTLDCDLLLFGQQMIADETLTVPHPHMLHRSFVLIPLLEIAPNLILPNQQPLQNFPISDHLSLTKLTE